MAERFRTIVQIIAKELDKGKADAFNKAIALIDNAGGKVQSILSSKSELLPKPILGNSAIVDGMGNKSLENPVILPLSASVVRWWQWYQRLIGMDKVEMCKHRVDLAQERLFCCQGERRRLSRETMIQNDRLKEVYAELLQTKRDDPRYVQLTILENKCLQDLGKIVANVNLLETEERDHFTVLATAIKEYHVSQDMCAQRYKYISILVSVLVAILSLVASMIYNNKRIVETRITLSQALDENRLEIASAIRSISQMLAKSPQPKAEAVAPTVNEKSLLEKVSDKLGIDKTYVAIGLGIFGIYFLKAVFE